MPYKPVFDNLPNTPTFMDVVKAWNKETFGNALFAFPKKGYAPHQQIQDIRKGKEITPLTTVAEIKKEIPKKEIPKKEKKPPSEKQKQARAKFSEMVKEKKKKTADKEKSVKEAIASIIKEEAVVIPKKEFKKEHTELVEVLKKGTDKQQKEEGKKQEAELKKEEQDADIVHLTLPDGKPWSYSKSALEKLETELEQAQKEVQAYLTELSKEDSGTTTKTLKLYGNLTKSESKELDEINNMIKGKRILKTDPIVKEYNKKVKEFEKRVKPAVEARSEKLRKLRQVRDDLLEKKMLMKGEVKAEDKYSGLTMTIEDSMDLFSRFAKAGGSSKKEEIKKLTENVSKAVDVNPDEDWRAKAGYKDTEWKDGFALGDFNRNSQLPQGYTKEEGYRWLENKYGDLYQEAIEKTKMLLEKSGSMTDKQAKEARRLVFKDGNQMKDFFRDVLLADPIIYNMLNINAFKTKAPATINGLREFKKWIGK